MMLLFLQISETPSKLSIDDIAIFMVAREPLEASHIQPMVRPCYSNPPLLCHTMYASLWYTTMQSTVAQHHLPHCHTSVAMWYQVLLILLGTSTVDMYSIRYQVPTYSPWYGPTWQHTRYWLLQDLRDALPP